MHEQVQLLKNIFQNKLIDSLDSVFPIVTQCKKKHDHNNLTFLRHTINTQLMERWRSEEIVTRPTSGQNAIPTKEV